MPSTPLAPGPLLDLPVATSRFGFLSESEALLNRKVETLGSFTTSMCVVGAVGATSFWIWDYATDPIGARQTLSLRFLFGGLVLVQASFKYLKNRRAWAALSVAAILVEEVVFVSILNHLHTGMKYGIGGLTFVVFIPMLLLTCFSWKVNVLSTLLTVSLPPILALMGYAPEFEHLHYAVLLWPTAALVSLVNVMSAKSYQYRFDLETALEAARNNQRRLVAILSHEFRNPLTGIDRAANLLEVAPNLTDGSAIQRLAGIRAQVARLHTVVDNILLTDPVNGDLQKPRREPISVASLFAGMRDALTQEMAERIVIDVSPARLELQGDARLLKLALSNLIDNALRYAPASTPVDVSAREQAGSFVLVVADRGPGVSTEALEQFGLPYNTKAANKQGTGLGYYFTRLIVLAHDGEIIPANREGGDLPSPFAFRQRSAQESRGS